MHRNFIVAPAKEKILDRLINTEMLYQEAIKEGLDKDPKLQEFIRNTLVKQLVAKEIESKAKVTEQAIKDYYEKHKKNFTPVRLSLIIVKTEEEARKVFAQLKKGEDFAVVAKKSSMAPDAAKNGGDLGYISPGLMLLPNLSLL